MVNDFASVDRTVLGADNFDAFAKDVDHLFLPPQRAATAGAAFIIIRECVSNHGHIIKEREVDIKGKKR